VGPTASPDNLDPVINRNMFPSGYLVTLYRPSSPHFIQYVKLCEDISYNKDGVKVIERNFLRV
jgi:hypothetical protein